MRVIVCGGRKYADRDQIAWALDEMLGQVPPHTVTLVHGGQQGADLTAASVGAGLGHAIEPHPADVDLYGSPAAFHIRNQEMVDAGAVRVIAFPGGKGTRNLCERAAEAHIPVTMILGDYVVVP